MQFCFTYHAEFWQDMASTNYPFTIHGYYDDTNHKQIYSKFFNPPAPAHNDKVRMYNEDLENLFLNTLVDYKHINSFYLNYFNID